MKDSVETLRKGSAVYLDGSTRKGTYKKRYSEEILTRKKNQCLTNGFKVGRITKSDWSADIRTRLQ